MAVSHVYATGEAATLRTFGDAFFDTAAIADGDVLVVSVTISDSGKTVTPADAGWTQRVDVSNVIRRYVFTRTAVTGDNGTTYRFNVSGSVSIAVSALVYRGVDTTTPVDVAGSTLDDGNTSTVTAPSVTSTRNGGMVVVFGAVRISSTLTTPSGTTSRSFFQAGNTSAGMSERAVDLALATAGGSGTKTFTQGNTHQFDAGTALALRSANLSPNAPLLVSPVGGAVVDRDDTTTFDWTFSDPDSGDSQSAFELRYRVQGGGAWTSTGKVDTPSTMRAVAGGTFADATTYEWQVRTYDAQGEVGPWSASETFVAESTPAAPSLTAPADGATVSTEVFDVNWSASEQDAYQLRRVADDGAGVPNTGTVYSDSGTVESPSARSQSVTFDVNGRDEHVQLRTRVDGLWSAWDSHLVSVSYTVPAAPSAVVTTFDATASISVSATHPTPSGGQPTVTSMDILRRVTSEGGDGIRIAAGIAPGGAHHDYTPASGVEYGYRIRAYGSNGTSVLSDWSEEATVGSFYGGGYPPVGSFYGGGYTT